MFGIASFGRGCLRKCSVELRFVKIPIVLGRLLSEIYL